jgi:murein DD-endopeptidase MepM/ murein hydrolase activator NlpD
VVLAVACAAALSAAPGAEPRAAAEPPAGVGPSAAADPTAAVDRPGGAAPAAAVPEVRRTVRYVRPVDGEVVRPFAPAGTPFGPGHRGVDLALAPGGSVRAAGAGVVRHAGPVAGTVWVSVDHADGITTSYGPLSALRIRRGDRVAAGTVLGRLAAGGHGHGGVDVGLHWGARRDGAYLDPLSLLAPSIPRRPALVGVGGWRGSDLAVEPSGRRSAARWDGPRDGAEPDARTRRRGRPPIDSWPS